MALREQLIAFALLLLLLPPPTAMLFAVEQLDCQRARYAFRVAQTDAAGRQCWDTIVTWACWGRCDSNEIADWRFPYKKSAHPVCVHHGRHRTIAELRHCDDGVDETARKYEYLEADDCRCQLCSSSDTSCEGLRYRPQRSQSEPPVPSIDLLGFHSEQNSS